MHNILNANRRIHIIRFNSGKILVKIDTQAKMIWNIFIVQLCILQAAFTHGFLFDGISDVVTVASNVGTILGTVKSVTFNGTMYNVKEYLGMYNKQNL